MNWAGEQLKKLFANKRREELNMKRIIFILTTLFATICVSAQTNFKSSYNGFYLSGGVGLAGGKLDIENSSTNMQLHTQGEFGYIHIFSNGLGISVSVSAMNIPINIRYSDFSITEDGLTDDEGDIYNLTTLYSNIQEKHTAWMIGLPIALQYRYMFTPRSGLLLSIGATPMLPAAQKFSSLSGQTRTEAYYPEWDITLHDIDGKFGTSDILPTTADEHIFRKFNLAAFAKLGFVFRLSEHFNLTTAFSYNQCVLNTLQNANDGKSNVSILETLLSHEKYYPYSVDFNLGLEVCF